MRTTFKSISQSLIFIVCIVVTLALASGIALAAPNCSYSYSSSYSYSYCNDAYSYNYSYSYSYNEFSFGYSQRMDYDAVVDYYRDWQEKAADVELNYRWSELNDLCKYYKQSPKAYMEALVDWTNEQIEDAVARAQRTRKDDVALLKSQEALLVSNIKYWSKVTGIEVICEYVDYYVDGQWVSIDPLRVV